MYNDSVRGGGVAPEGLGFADIRPQGIFNSRSTRRRAGGEAEGNACGMTVKDWDTR